MKRRIFLLISSISSLVINSFMVLFLLLSILSFTKVDSPLVDTTMQYIICIILLLITIVALVMASLSLTTALNPKQYNKFYGCTISGLVFNIPLLVFAIFLIFASLTADVWILILFVSVLLVYATICVLNITDLVIKRPEEVKQISEIANEKQKDE